MTAKRISAAEYLEAHRSHAPTTVDLRTAAEADSECLEGCLSLPVQELNKETFGIGRGGWNEQRTGGRSRSAPTRRPQIRFWLRGNRPGTTDSRSRSIR